MYGEIVAPSANYADLIVNNDGIQNLALEVLTCVFQRELEMANDGLDHVATSSNEFTEDVLSSVFQESEIKE
jgi:hypothetical protein